MNTPPISPVIVKHILSEKWMSSFNAPQLKLGQRLFKNGHVEVDYLDSLDGDTLHVEISIEERSCYQIAISFTNSGQFTAACDCPIPGACKHSAAGFFALSKLLQDTSTEPVKECQNLVNKWVDQLQASLGKSSHQIHQLQSGDEFAPNYKERVVYVLDSVYYSDESYLIAKKGRLLKGGNYSISDTNVKPRLNIQTKPKYVSLSDLKILKRFVAAAPYQYQCQVDQNSPLFSEILTLCAGSNRLIIKDKSIYIQPNAHHSYTPFSLGKPRPLTPAWESSINGMLRPSIEVHPPIHTHLSVSPKVYVDNENHEVGILEQHFTDAFLESWTKGPSLDPQQAQEIQPLLATLKIPQSEDTALTHEVNPSIGTSKDEQPRPTVTIPIPPIAKKLVGLKPLPNLNIKRCDISPASNIFLKATLINVLVGEVEFLYGSAFVKASNTSAHFTDKQGDTLYTIERDLKQEKRLLAQLRKQELTSLSNLYSEPIHTSHEQSLAFSIHDSPNTLQWLTFLAAQKEDLKKKGWVIETIGDLGYTIQEFDDFYEELEESENDWFRFDLGIEHEGRRISLIPALATAIASGAYAEYDFPTELGACIPIQLDEAKLIINFPAARFKEILDKVTDIFQHLNEKGEIEVPRLRAATLVDDLDMARANQTLKDLAALGKQLKSVKGLPKITLPKNLNAELRDYQIEGFRWLQFLAKYRLHGVLADDMGLGKTIQVLTHILAEKNAKRNKKLPTLVIAPTSVIPNWRSESAKFTPSLKVLLLHGSDRRDQFDQISKHDIVLTSYALLQRDQAIHLDQHYHMAVLDESQYIKNAAAKTTKVAGKLNANHRICLSGTPMENHLGELWSTFNFLMPGLLQNHKSFNSTFRNPIEKRGDSARQTSLIRRIGPLILRRTKDVVAKELPPKTIIPHHIQLNQEQVDLYESVRATMDKRVRDAIKQQGLSKSHIIILDALLKLRQICCHPQLLKLEQAQKIQSSAKLDHLTELLGTLIEEGRRILIFSQFTTMLAIIEKHLVKEKIEFTKITGATRDRQAPVEKFQTGEVPVFLISLKAGGTGLNLTAADTVIHYDPWWNPAAENQATDRAYRIGQDKPVFVHKLICQGTIEEHIQELQVKKAKLVESLLAGSTNKLSLTTETLNGLLAPIDV